jgi:hypothetical protein
MNKQMTAQQSVMFVIVIAIAVFITMQVVYGQEQVNNSNSTVGKSMVDKLIEDTKKSMAIEKSYRAELINRIENSTCLSEIFEGTPLSLFNNSNMKTEQLEQTLTSCVTGGIIN